MLVIFKTLKWNISKKQLNNEFVNYASTYFVKKLLFFNFIYNLFYIVTPNYKNLINYIYIKYKTNLKA